MAKSKFRKIYAIGDAHGNYYSFSAVLICAGIMDPELNWTAGNSIVVQMGDILDRGDSPLEIDRLLDVLAIQAKKAGGQIIRLVGNHELEILRKNYHITSLPYFHIEAFRRKLIRGILAGAWQAAYSARYYLFTHAGVCDGLYPVLKEEIGQKRPSLSKISAHINEVFLEAVRTDSYHHAIFNVSHLRGGRDRYGGIFWEDLTSLIAGHEYLPYKQIVGHTRTGQIVRSEDSKILAIDVGMEKVFDGKFEYLEFNSSGKPEAVGVK